MRETTYSRLLLDWIVPTRNPRLARAVTDGLLLDAHQVRARLGSRPVHAWTVNGPPAPDGALGFEDDTAAVALEVKRAHRETTSNATNWHARATLRAAYRTQRHDDPISRSVYRAYLADTDPTLDTPHNDGDCAHQPCVAWSWSRGRPGLHHPVVHQGDAYAATTRWVPEGMTATGSRDFAFLLVAPTAESTRKFFDGLVSKAAWSVSSLPGALDYWTAIEHDVPGMRAVVDITREFLPA